MNIYEHHEVLGWFFLPEDPDNRVPGVLKWDPAKGAEIELIGSFSTPAIPSLKPGVVYDIPDEMVASMPVQTIYLEADNGKKYSIWDAWMSSCSYNIHGEQRRNGDPESECWTSGKPYKEQWLSRLVYVGDHVLPEGEIFTEATFCIDELYYLVNDSRILPPEWCQMKWVERPGEILENGTFLSPYVLPVLGGFQAGKFEGNTEDARYSINTVATRPWISEATQADPWLKLRFMLKHQRHGLVLPISVDASISITLRKNGEETEDLAGIASELLDQFALIHDLMRLATFQPCGVYRIDLKQKNEDNNEPARILEDLGFTSDDIDPSSANTGHLLKKPKFGEVARPHERHDDESVVFTLNDVSLENFLEKREYLTSTNGAISPWCILIGLCGYFSNYAEEYISQSFAAAEGFHKLCLGKGDSNEQEQKYSLNGRLKELYSLLPQEIQEKLKFNVDEWAGCAVKARNYAAHGGPMRPNNSTNLSDRYVIAVSVFLVTYLVVLNELGVPAEKICDALLNHPKLLIVMRYCDEVHSMLES